MVDINFETWNQAAVSVIRVHENDNVNKTILLSLGISDASKIWGGKNIYDLKKSKGNMGLKNEPTYNTIK